VQLCFDIFFLSCWTFAISSERLRVRKRVRETERAQLNVVVFAQS